MKSLYVNPATGSVDTEDGWHYKDMFGAEVSAVELNEVTPANTIDFVSLGDIVTDGKLNYARVKETVTGRKWYSSMDFSEVNVEMAINAIYVIDLDVDHLV